MKGSSIQTTTPPILRHNRSNTLTNLLRKSKATQAESWNSLDHAVYDLKIRGNSKCGEYNTRRWRTSRKQCTTTTNRNPPHTIITSKKGQPNMMQKHDPKPTLTQRGCTWPQLQDAQNRCKHPSTLLMDRLPCSALVTWQGCFLDKGGLRRPCLPVGGSHNLVHIWDARVPNRGRVFGWLFYLDRLNTRETSTARPSSTPHHALDATLHRKTGLACLSTVQPPLLSGTLLVCYQFHRHCRSCDPHRADRGLPTSVWPLVLLLVSCKIWDARNAATFRDEHLSPADAIRSVISNLTLWTHRLKKAYQKINAGLWQDFFSPLNSVVTIFLNIFR